MKDLSGEVFNSWTVIREVNRDKQNKRVWECLCKCGASYNLTQGNLVSGKSQMCRKCSLDLKSSRSKKEDHRLYSVWKGVKSRCDNPNRKYYHRYGGRGIKVCARWYDFDLFLKDMYETFEEGLTLDRIDVNGDYSPENCRWADIEQQANNKTDSLELLFDGEYYTEAQLARKTGVKRTTIQVRRGKGYSVEEMVYGKSTSQAPKPVEYEGIIYPSLKHVALAFNIEPNTFRYRIRNNWGLDNSIKGIKP